MILSNGEIWNALEAGDIVIPAPREEQILVHPSSVDLRLRSILLVHSHNPIPGVTIDPTAVNVMDHLERYCEKVDISNGSTYEIQPQSFVIRTPLDLAGRVEGKSSLARFGSAVHITAAKIDPGFKNPITLEMFNLSSFPLKLTYTMKICSLTFERLGRTSKQGYEGQCQGEYPIHSSGPF